jgi:hypothetical protein
MTKKKQPVSRYDKMAAVSRIKDPKSPYRHHNIYPDKKLGFVCFHKETDKIIASDKNKRKCEEKARNEILITLSKEGGKNIGKNCIFEKDGKYLLGTIIDSHYSFRYSGLGLYYTIMEKGTGIVTQEIDNYHVCKGNQIQMGMLNTLYENSKHYNIMSEDYDHQRMNLLKKLSFED